MRTDARGKALTIVELCIGVDSDNAAMRERNNQENYRSGTGEVQKDVAAAREVRRMLRRNMRRALAAKMRMVNGDD